MAAKPKQTFRLPERTRGQLEDLAIPGRRTMTDAVVMAVDLLHGRSAHDDAVDLLVNELRDVRQTLEKQAETIGTLSAQLQAVEAVAGAVASLERSIDKLGQHQIHLAQTLTEKLTQPAQPAQPVSRGLFGRG